MPIDFMPHWGYVRSNARKTSESRKTPTLQRASSEAASRPRRADTTGGRTGRYQPFGLDAGTSYKGGQKGNSRGQEVRALGPGRPGPNGEGYGDEGMTQLISVICEDGKKVITLSDRMVSTGDMTLVFEHPSMKGEPISNNAIVLTAGTVHEPDLITRAKDKIRGKTRIIEMAHVLKSEYQELREEYIVDKVLRAQAGIKSFEEWHQKQKGLHDATVMSISEGISSYKLGLTLMLAGVDSQGHVFRIGHPGTYSSYDNLSYCCIGMGTDHAENVFAWYKYSQKFPLHDALYVAFEAKKKSEMAGGVGSSTDIFIIDEEGMKTVDNGTIQALEEVYNEREKGTERTGFDKRITELKIQTSQVEI